MELEKLKSHAYDCIANINAWQKELNATEAAIEKKFLEKKEEVLPEQKKKEVLPKEKKDE